MIDACLNMDEWPSIRSVTSHLGAATADLLATDDGSLAACFANMRAAGLTLSVGGAAFQPGGCGLGSQCFADVSPHLHHWIDDLGAPQILYRMDEPLRKGLDAGWAFDDIVFQTVDFMNLLRSEFGYAGILISSIEAYPRTNFGTVAWWQTSLHNNGSDPDLFELDNDLNQCCTEPSEIAQLEAGAHFLGYGFGYICGEPITTSGSWIGEMNQQGFLLQSHGIVPDIYSIEAGWDPPYQPSVIVPEWDSSTFMGGAYQFRARGYFPR
jgi:hypothetical protein